jgi:hypothetical protein
MSYHAAINLSMISSREAATRTTTRFYIAMRASAEIALRGYSHDTVLRVLCLSDILINPDIPNKILKQPRNHEFELHPNRFGAFVFVGLDDQSGIVSQ